MCNMLELAEFLLLTNRAKFININHKTLLTVAAISSVSHVARCLDLELEAPKESAGVTLQAQNIWNKMGQVLAR